MSLYYLDNGILRIEISSQGAEIQSIKYKGVDYLWSGDPTVWKGRAPVLFPICGSLKGNRFIHNNKVYFLEKHGFARHMEFSAEKSKTEGDGDVKCDTSDAPFFETSEISFVLESDSSTLNVYPFHFLLKITYKINANKLNVIYDVENCSGETMYFSIGSHEAYFLPDGVESCELHFPFDENFESSLLEGPLLTGGKHIISSPGKILPIKKDYFKFDTVVFEDIKSKSLLLKIINKNGYENKNNREIEIKYDDFSNLLIWAVPDGNFICIEPWEGLPDMTKSDGVLKDKKGIVSLFSGETKRFAHSLEFV